MGKSIKFSDETIRELKKVIGDDEPREGERMRICIVDNRGLTFVGKTDLKYNLEPEGCKPEFITIRDARCIIRWGTSGHLAELAEKGPMSNTKLGTARTVRVTEIIAVYECGSGWYE